MTQQASPGGVPVLTLGWRLRMALDYGDVSVQAMADQLGVARATLSRWMSDRGAPPKKAYVSQWALKTGVPEEWLTTGRVTPKNDPDGSGGARASAGATPVIHEYLQFPVAELPRPDPWETAAQSIEWAATNLTQASLDRAA